MYASLFLSKVLKLGIALVLVVAIGAVARKNLTLLGEFLGYNAATNGVLEDRKNQIRQVFGEDQLTDDQVPLTEEVPGRSTDE